MSDSLEFRLLKYIVAVAETSNFTRVALFTDNIAQLTPQLATNVSKTSAIELRSDPLVTQGIGMGL